MATGMHMDERSIDCLVLGLKSGNRELLLMMIVLSYHNCFKVSNSSGDTFGVNLYFLSFCIISFVIESIYK